MDNLKLKRSWSLYHDLMWTDLRLVGSFDSIVGFWKLFNNIESVSGLKHKTNLRFFETGIEPKREDKHNENGGMWSVQFYKDSFIDEEYENLLLDMIGEVWEKYNVNGLELNVRDRGHRINIWTRDFTADFAEYLAENCGQSVVSIAFKMHKDILSSGSTFVTSSTFCLNKKK